MPGLKTHNQGKESAIPAEQRWATGKSQQWGHLWLSPMVPLSKPKGLQKEEIVGGAKFQGMKGHP